MTDKSHSSHEGGGGNSDRQSTRLNSSHYQISYTVCCLNNKMHPKQS